MSTILEIDKFQRKIISIFFRFIIISYSIFLLNYYEAKYLWYINSGAIVLYLIIYFLLYTKDKWVSILRLINDYVFITFILLQLNDFNIFSFALLFAPILNTHNHSGDRKSILLYIIPLISLFIVLPKFEFWLIIPFFFFLIINSFDNLRSKYFRFQQKLNSVIDDFFINENLYNRPYKIYENAIPIFNNSKTLPKKVSKIICLKVADGRFIIVNGSSFIWQFDILNKEEFFKKIENSNILFNIELVIDGILIKNNLISIYPINSHFYCYIIISENHESFQQIPFSLFIQKLISPFFHRLSKVFDADLKQKKNELTKLTELEEKINYVTNSVNSMHFIRNKLGPVKSYLAMVEDYNRTSDKEKQKKIEPYLVKERQKLNASIIQILERADYILTKSNNPFNVYQIELYGIQQLFSEIRRVWNYFFDIEPFKINWNVQKDRIKYDVKYNFIGIELVLSNWISNMYKYNNGDFGVEFNETDEFYNITFYNSIDISDSNSTKFITEYTTSDRVEITRRNSNGLLEVKDFLSQMKITDKMYSKEDKIYFSLDFKKYLYHESSNI